MEPSQLILKRRLQELLQQYQWTAAELSRRSGVPKQVLSLWLSGVEPRKISHLKNVARTLGVSVDDLCFTQEGSSLVGEWIEGVFEGRIRVTRPNRGESE